VMYMSDAEALEMVLESNLVTEKVSIFVHFCIINKNHHYYNISESLVVE